MMSSRKFFRQPSWLVYFVYAPGINSCLRNDWSSERLDAVFVIKLLCGIPNRICIKGDHINCDFSDRIISMGRVVGESVFAVRFFKISDDVYGCANSPFNGFKASEIDVLIGLRHPEHTLYPRILNHHSFSICYD